METIGMVELDTLIARGSPVEAASLDGLEDGVWRRVEQAQNRTRDRSLRFAALGIAAAIGGVAGGMTAPTVETGRSELSIFSPRIAATPLGIRSTLG
jgi:hypothetical protein